MRSERAAEWRGLSIERLLRVQRVKLAGPGLDSIMPERRRRARRKGLRQRKVRERMRMMEKEGGIWVG